jgi:hypothetical protein
MKSPAIATRQRNDIRGTEARRGIGALAFLASTLLFGAAPSAQAQPCSNAILRGAYGFHGLATITPAGTPRAIIGVFNFDGRGTWSANLILDDDGTITPRPNQGGTYVVNADCSGMLLPTAGGTGAIAIVVVDGGKEVYQMRLDPSNIVLYSVTKKISAGSD